MNFEQLLTRMRAGETLTAAELRFLIDGMTTRAAAMPATITAETSPEDAIRVEREHSEALEEIGRARARLALVERAAAASAAQASAAAVTGPEVSAEVRAAIETERGRISTIRTDGRHFGRSDEFVERHVAQGTDAAAFRLAILEEMRVASDRNPTFSHATIQRDETETRREGMAAAIVEMMALAAGECPELPEIARPWAGRSLIDLAAECAGFHGRNRFLTGRDIDDIFRRAFLSTSDFPAIFTNALNVRLLARYQTAAPTYRRWAAQYNNPDFRTSNVVRAGDFPTLQQVLETGEIKSGSFSESKETHQVYAYGVMLNISRVMMVNDQLMAIDQVLGSAGARVADWENVQAYTSLLSGGARGPSLLTDSLAVFHATHANLDDTGAAISVTSVGAGRAAMMKQTTLDGLKANFTPTTLLTGPDGLTAAEQLLTSITPATSANAVPQSMRQLSVVGDANIDTDAWYLFADPGVAPCFVYGYLNGFEGPRLTSEDVFDVQGMRVKLEHDFGVSAIDYRGGYRNDGASGSP